MVSVTGDSTFHCRVLAAPVIGGIALLMFLQQIPGSEFLGMQGLVDALDYSRLLGFFTHATTILVLVPEPDLARWREVTGGEIAELPCEADALRRWWRDRTTGIAHGTLENGDQVVAVALPGNQNFSAVR